MNNRSLDIFQPMKITERADSLHLLHSIGILFNSIFVFMRHLVTHFTYSFNIFPVWLPMNDKGTYDGTSSKGRK